MRVFDAHLHIIDPLFPLVENQGFIPTEFTVENYNDQVEGIGIVGGAVVSGSFQGFDQSYLIHALEKLGSSFFGVANVPSSISQKELESLDNAGVRAVRFNLFRGGSTSINDMNYLSDKLFEEFGWHTEVYLDSKDLGEIGPLLQKIKKLSIDHFGLSQQGMHPLAELIGRGAYVKATGFGRVDLDPVEAMKLFYSINPKALMFGTDLPSTRAGRPFSREDIHLIKETFEGQDLERILYQNATDLYMRK